MSHFKKCAVKPHTKIDLEEIDPAETFGWTRADAEEQTEKNLKCIAELQNVLHAEQKHSVLMCLQAMDTGGKDGTIKIIGGAMNPAGVRVASFKKPTKEELEHDFLWRIKKQMPSRPGEFVIFNRSHYEDVGVVRVHNIVPEYVWRKRYDIINAFEKAAAHPTKNLPCGITILKFFLHIGPDEQLERLRERMADPDKHYKVSEADFKERPFWHQYMAAYSEALSRCTAKEAPWFVIPANHKWMRDLIISQIVVDTLEGFEMTCPQPAVDIDTIKKRYFEADGRLKTEFDVRPA